MITKIVFLIDKFNNSYLRRLLLILYIFFSFQFTVRNHGKYTLNVVKELIKHGRTLRLQPLNNYRKRFNLKPFKSFEELTGQFINLLNFILSIITL